MIRHAPPAAPVRASDSALIRTDLLHSAFLALDGARDLDERASRRGADRRAALLRGRLDAHREILARRAANVALATVCTAEELHELRDAARILVSVRGWVARQLGLVGQLS